MVQEIYSNTSSIFESMEFFDDKKTDNCRDDALFKMNTIHLSTYNNLTKCFDKKTNNFFSSINMNKLETDIFWLSLTGIKISQFMPDTIEQKSEDYRKTIHFLNDEMFATLYVSMILCSSSVIEKLEEQNLEMERQAQNCVARRKQSSDSKSKLYRYGDFS